MINEDKGFCKKTKSDMKKEEEEKEEKIPLPYSGKPKDDDNDDDEGKGMNIKSTPRKTSDEYRLEITLLESEKDKLISELEKYKSEIPKLEDINIELVDKLEKMQDELNMLKTIEDSKEKDYQESRRRYDEQMKDAENKTWGCQTKNSFIHRGGKPTGILAYRV